MLFLILAVEHRVVALMQTVDILVVAVHDRWIELRDGVDAEVGALVGDTLSVDENIEEHESRVDRTLPVAQTADVVGAERCHHIVHDLLHRLDAAGGLRVHGGEAAVGIVHDLAQSLAEHLQLLLRGLGKFDALAAQLLGILREIHGIVADALKLGEALDVVVQQVIAVPRRDMAGELDEIIVHAVGQSVDVVLVAVDHVDGMPVEMMQNVQCAHHACARKARHGADGVRRGGERQRGRSEELFIELG